jgi:hypothetical protein
MAALAICIGVQTLAFAQQQKQWKDREEYDLYQAILSDQNPNSKLDKLKQWATKYPDSQYADLRAQALLFTYQQLNRPADVFAAAPDVLKFDANNLQALNALVFYVFALAPPTAEQNDLATKAANHLLSNIDTLFAADKKPQGVQDAQWAAAKKDVQTTAQRALGWMAMQKKDFATAETEMVKSLNLEPNNSQVSYWLGSVLMNDARARKAYDKVPNALFAFARAGAHEGPGALPEAARKQALEYFERQYNQFHGGKDGMEEVVALAKGAALPPAGFKIKSIKDKLEEEQGNMEKLRTENPALFLWVNIKKELTGDKGAEYFEQIKGSAMPGGAEGVKKFKAKLISATPETNPTELVLGIADTNAGDVKIKLDSALRGKMEPGVDLQFEGVATGYTKEPFQVQFEVEKASLVGWAGAGAAPAPKKAVPVAPAKRPVAPVKKK